MRIGVVSYNIHCNFTNYGSALQSWALNQTIKGLGYTPVLVDYCPDVLKYKHPLQPFGNMWDKDAESIKMCQLTMPAIKENYYKFERFYTEKFNRSRPYNSSNFNEITDEVEAFVCGADTIFSPDEFNLDDGYLANYDCMRGNAVSYAASFGDPHFSEVQYELLNEKIRNFKALGIREQLMIPYLKGIIDSSVPIQQVIDPTLLLDADYYVSIMDKKRMVEDEYILYYSRRYNPQMERYAEQMAQKTGYKLVEISLRATNADKGHIMFYNAGVEEFLSLVKNAEYIITNSYHGMIFGILFQKEFVVFSRALCDNKITELLEVLGIENRLLIAGAEKIGEINYETVFSRLIRKREESVDFLKKALKLL